MNKLIKQTPYFDLYQVSPSAYAAIKTAPEVMSNAGFILLGEQTIIWDTFLNWDAALALKQEAEALGGHDHFIVVNSHGHLDHLVGNGVFAAYTPIIASARARQDALDTGKEICFGAQKYHEEYEQSQQQLQLAKDPDERLDVLNSLAIQHNLMDARIKLTPPNQVLHDQLEIWGNKGCLTLNLMPEAHSEGDIVGIFKDEGVVFAGDLLFHHEHPWLGRGNPRATIAELTRWLEMDVVAFIPGHGGVCDKEGIREQIEYIEFFLELAQRFPNQPEKIKLTDLPEKFQTWGGPCFRWNVNALTAKK